MIRPTSKGIFRRKKSKKKNGFEIRSLDAFQIEDVTGQHRCRDIYEVTAAIMQLNIIR